MSQSRLTSGVRSLFGVLILLALATPGFAQATKARTYALALTPLEIADGLPALKLGDPAPALSADERKLLARVWELKTTPSAGPAAVDEAVLLDAMLFASGIDGTQARRKYGEQVGTLLADARKFVKEAKDDRERGDLLMKFLHAGVMKRGYEASQTSLAAVFDTGRFNCVSATAMYYLVGTRLGLELRALSIPGNGFLPGHAALDLILGNERIQIEPTNADGFDWQAKLKRPGVTVFGFVPDREQAHEVDAFGIAAMIYSNRGVAYASEKPPKGIEAARCYLAALALDPTDAVATSNLESLFVNWGPALTSQKKFEDAVRVLGFGLTIAPKSDALKNNHRIAWEQYIEATLRAGKDQDALALMERAAKAVPYQKDFQSTSYWFRRHGDNRLAENDWEASLAVVERGVKALSSDEGKKLQAWSSSVFRRWSQSLLRKDDVEGSLKVLVRAYAVDPGDRDIRAAIAYHTQEALAIVEKRAGLPAMLQHYELLRTCFPKVAEVSERGWSHAVRALGKLTDARKFKEALELVVQCQPLAAQPGQQAELGGIAYDQWAHYLARRKDWKEALDKYKEGLTAYPRQGRLLQNAAATADEWAQTAIHANNWDEAIRIYELGLEYFPGSSHLRGNRQHCEEMKKQKR